MKLGLIGAGPWGRNYIKTIAALPELALSAVASRNPETRALVGPGCAVTSDWRELAQDKGLDGVIIAAPPALHAEMASACLERGLPVLVEKPLAMEPASANELLALARRKKGFALVDHIYLFHPAYAELRNRARRLGPPALISAAVGNKGPFRPDARTLWDYGPHDVALCLDFLGEKPKAVEAKFRPQKQGELIDMRLDFSQGLQARLCVGNGMQKRESMFCVRWRDVALTLDDQGPRALVLSKLDQYGKPKDEGEEIAVEKALPLTKAVEAFASAIKAKSKDLSSLELGAAVVDILARCEAQK
ncbi:MAG: Gfo/Idh/MocA family oxidoreductase [Elusimicrobia bacterium]|nr:Gfo/Idh/MocA family oxidoreductase [Elusimicrobiota bacterium]